MKFTEFRSHFSLLTQRIISHVPIVRRGSPRRGDTLIGPSSEIVQWRGSGKADLGKEASLSIDVLDLWTNGAFTEATKLLEKMARTILSYDLERQTHKSAILVTE
jgi:hypothetical protein